MWHTHLERVGERGRRRGRNSQLEWGQREAATPSRCCGRLSHFMTLLGGRIKLSGCGIKLIFTLRTRQYLVGIPRRQGHAYCSSSLSTTLPDLPPHKLRPAPVGFMCATDWNMISKLLSITSNIQHSTLPHPPSLPCLLAPPLLIKSSRSLRQLDTA